MQIKSSPATTTRRASATDCGLVLLLCFASSCLAEAEARAQNTTQHDTRTTQFNLRQSKQATTRLEQETATITSGGSSMTTMTKEGEEEGEEANDHHNHLISRRHATTSEQEMNLIMMNSNSNTSNATNNNNNNNKTVTVLNAFEAASLGYFRHPLSTSVIITIAYTIVFIVGIIGNSFVVAIVCKSPRMRTVTNYFIANLALADILVLLFCLPATLVSNLFIPYVLGLFVCKTVSYLQGVAVSASINTMVAVTLDRFLAICFPMDWHMSRRMAKWTIACIWLFSMFIMLPWAIYFELISFDGDDGRKLQVCAENWPSPEMGKLYFVCANLILLYLLPAAVIILCYLGIWYKIERRDIPGDRPKGLKIELILQKSKLKAVKMMMVVVVIFLLSWAPLYLIFARHKLATERSDTEDWLISRLMPLAQWLGASNSCINPILYTFFNRKYKRGFIDLLKLNFCFCCSSTCGKRKHRANSQDQPQQRQLQAAAYSNGVLLSTNCTTIGAHQSGGGRSRSTAAGCCSACQQQSRAISDAGGCGRRCCRQQQQRQQQQQHKTDVRMEFILPAVTSRRLDQNGALRNQSAGSGASKQRCNASSLASTTTIATTATTSTISRTTATDKRRASSALSGQVNLASTKCDSFEMKPSLVVEAKPMEVGHHLNLDEQPLTPTPPPHQQQTTDSNKQMPGLIESPEGDPLASSKQITLTQARDSRGTRCSRLSRGNHDDDELTNPSAATEPLGAVAVGVGDHRCEQEARSRIAGDGGSSSARQAPDRHQIKSKCAAGIRQQQLPLSHDHNQRPGGGVTGKAATSVEGSSAISGVGQVSANIVKGAKSSKNQSKKEKQKKRRSLLRHCKISKTTSTFKERSPPSMLDTANESTDVTGLSVAEADSQCSQSATMAAEGPAAAAAAASCCGARSNLGQRCAYDRSQNENIATSLGGPDRNNNGCVAEKDDRCMMTNEPEYGEEYEEEERDKDEEDDDDEDDNMLFGSAASSDDHDDHEKRPTTSGRSLGGGNIGVGEHIGRGLAASGNSIVALIMNGLSSVRPTRGSQDMTLGEQQSDHSRRRSATMAGGDSIATSAAAAVAANYNNPRGGSSRLADCKTSIIKNCASTRTLTGGGGGASCFGDNLGNGKQADYNV